MKNKKLILTVLGITFLVSCIGVSYFYINHKQDIQQQNNLIEENFKANTEIDIQTSKTQSFTKFIKIC